MDGHFERVASLFERARHVAPGAREAFLRESCGDDVALRDEVADLLRAHDAVPPAERDPIVSGAARAAGVLGAPSSADAETPRVEGFRVVRRLAEGGMGTVYLAEQEKPRRSVALKVLRPEAATPEGRRRFEREAEVLARLEHPGIARVLLFGTTEPPGEPRPFLVMELVEGEPLTAAARRMGLEERLALLAEVAEAVAHAHARGVIHRDLKPDNVLVQENGRPKVVDFGVARLVEDDVARTRAGLVIGTLAYMSPEQARGDTAAVDTRSDVYALGVVAYEVLTGRHPLGEGAGTFPELVRRIETEAPPDPGEVDRRLRGDVRLILRKALEKEPEQRYAGASAFADDLRRHLRDEPILARPMTGAYQVRRLVRRHKRAVALGAAALAALVSGLVFALDLAHSEQRHRLRADAGAEVLRRALAQRSVDVAAGSLRQLESTTAKKALSLVPEDLRGWEWRHLAAEAEGSLEVEPIGLEQIRDGRVGPGRQWIVRGASGELRCRRGDDAEGRPVALPEGVRRPMLPRLGGTPVICGHVGDEVVVVDTAGGAMVSSRIVVSRPLEVAAGSDDGRFLAVGFGGKRSSCPLYLLDAKTGAKLWRSTSGLVETGALAFSPDASLLACGGWDSKVHLVDVASGKRSPQALVGHTGVALALAFSPDGTRLASGSRDRTAHVWDVASRAEVQRLSGHTGEVGVVAFSPDGRLVATGSSDSTVRVWDLATGAATRVFLGHEGTVRDVGFEGDGVLASLAADGVRRWHVGPDPAVLRFHRDAAQGNPHPYVYAVSFSPDGRLLASAGWDGTVRVVDVATSDLLLSIEIGNDTVRDVLWTPDGRWLVGGHARLVRWDPFTGDEVASWTGPATDGIAVTPDGTRVLSADGAGVVRVHRIDDLEPVAAWEGNGPDLFDLSVSPQGDRVASVSQRGTVVVRALASGAELWRRRAHPTAPFAAVAFSPDGRRLASGGGDRLVRIWDAATGEETRVLAGHNDAVYGLAWTPGGDRLLSGSNDATLRVWDPDSGQARLELRGHTSYVYRVDVSPDGTTVATASGDNTVRLWSTRATPRRERDRVAARAARAEAERHVAARLAAGTAPRALADELFRDASPGADARAARLQALMRHVERGRAPRPVAGD